MKHLYLAIFLSVLLFSAAGTQRAEAQCNTATSICNSTAGPFTFVTPGPPVSTCLDWIGPNVAYIMLYITQSGPLNMLIQGNSSTGFLDVAVFNIPPGSNPCNAIQNNSNQIGCNYASSPSGCNQFGNSFGCPSTIPAPYVTAGQVLMIVVENWSGTSSSFTLSLGPAPGAQSGLPNATINPVSNNPCVNGAPFQLTAVNNGGTWSGPGVSPSGMFNPAAAGVGTHTITYTVGTAPCNATSTTTVTVNPLPTITVSSAPTTICASQTATLTATGGNTYNWSGGLGTGNPVNVTPSATTTYTVTGTVNGCSRTATTTVNVIPYLNITSNSPTICDGDSALLVAAGGSSYTWSNGASGDSIYVSPNMQSDYTVVGSDLGCYGTATSTVYVNPIPPVEVNSPFTCPGIPVNLTVSGANSYTWIPSGQTLVTVTVPGVAATYDVVGESLGCRDTVTATVTTIAVPELNLTASMNEGCVPLTVTFSGDGTNYPFTGYSWDFGDGGMSNLSNPEHTYTTTGCKDVMLTATYATGCIVSDTAICLVDVSPQPEAAFAIQPSTVITTPNASFSNLSLNSDAWIWHFGEGVSSTEENPDYSYMNPGTYEVILIANNTALGCSDTAVQTIVVNSEVAVYIPNSFTPNEDGVNDVFLVRGKGLVDASLVVFDRWGEAIVRLEKDQAMTVGWDGTYNGELVKQDIYTYKVTIIDVRGDTHEYTGNVNVIR